MVLCLALGAVQTESFAQTTPNVRIRIPSQVVLLGGTVDCSLSWPAPIGSVSQVMVFVGFDEGATSIVVGTQTLVLPLAGATFTVATSATIGSNWIGSLAIPTDPSFLGRRPLAVALVQTPTRILLSPVCPFGPIIEDSIN